MQVKGYLKQHETILLQSQKCALAIIIVSFAHLLEKSIF